MWRRGWLTGIMRSEEAGQLLLSMKNAEDNMRWLQSHIERLLPGYSGQWVAIDHGRVVASDRDRESLLEELRKEHSDFQVCAILLVTSDPIDLIL